MKALLLAALVIAFSATWAAEEARFVEKYIAAYPFVAPPERAAAITANYTKIKNGITADQVESVLGVPDEVRPLYEPKLKNGKAIGYTYWYVLRRAREKGSVKEKDESLVRVSFDTNGKVTRVDRW
jgi:hypothetical protein